MRGRVPGYWTFGAYSSGPREATGGRPAVPYLWHTRGVRTTVDIPDVLYRRLKRRAAEEGRSVRALLLDAAEHAVDEPRLQPGRRVRLPLIKSKRPGTLIIDNAKIHELIGFP